MPHMDRFGSGVQWHIDIKSIKLFSPPIVCLLKLSSKLLALSREGMSDAAKEKSNRLV